MPTRLKRYYGTRHLHFITCSCYHRQAWLGSTRRRELFLRVFEAVRRYDFVVVGYVVMPEHIHLLISEPEKGDPSKVMQAIKQRFARRVLRQVRRRRVAVRGETLPQCWSRLVSPFRRRYFTENASGRQPGSR